MPEQTRVEETTTTEHANPSQIVTKVTKVASPQVQTEHPQRVFEKKKVIFRTHQIIWYILGVIEVLLIFRIFLRMFGAYPTGFANFIYFSSAPLALPFRGILKVTDEGAIIEWSTFIAMIVYALVAYGLVKLLQIIKPVTPQEVEKEVDK